MYINNKNRKRKCPHPNCPVPERPGPWEFSQCTLNKPIWIVIPPGGHIHLDCPVHPEGHIIYGPDIRWCDRFPRPRWDTPKWRCETNLPGAVPTPGVAGWVDYEASSKRGLVDYTTPRL